MRFPGHEGDGIQMAWNAGVKQSEMIEEMIFDIFQPGSTGAYTNDIKLVMQQPNLMVNQQGKRFFNEEQVQNTTYTGNSLRNQTGNTGFMILDEAIKQSYVEANHVDFTSRVWNTDDFTQFDANFKTMEESGYTAIVKADTLEELANKMGIDPQGLAATVEEYNQLVRRRLRSVRQGCGVSQADHDRSVLCGAVLSIQLWHAGRHQGQFQSGSARSERSGHHRSVFGGHRFLHGLRRQLHVPASRQHDGLFRQHWQVCRRSGQRTAEKISAIPMIKRTGVHVIPVFILSFREFCLSKRSLLLSLRFPFRSDQTG